MIYIVTLIIGTLAWQHDLQSQLIRPAILPEKCLFFAALLYILSEKTVPFPVIWITFLEEIFFRGILLDCVINTHTNNILSGIVFGLYGTLYIGNISTALVYGIMGYFLASARKNMYILELFVIRSLINIFVFF